MLKVMITANLEETYLLHFCKLLKVVSRLLLFKCYFLYSTLYWLHLNNVVSQLQSHVARQSIYGDSYLQRHYQ